MASSAGLNDVAASNRLSVLRVAAATSLTATSFLLLCWTGARLGLGPATHMYIGLFAAEPAGSVGALVIGLCWSLIGGLVAGGIFAALYNMLAPLTRR